MVRNLFCEFYGNKCPDLSGRCKKGLCIAANEEKTRELAAHTANELAWEETVGKEARNVAIGILKNQHRPIVEENIQKLMKRPDVRAVAVRRAKEVAELVESSVVKIRKIRA